jgi:hypothetical protein
MLRVNNATEFLNRRDQVLLREILKGRNEIDRVFSMEDMKVWNLINQTDKNDVKRKFFAEAFYVRSHYYHLFRTTKFVSKPLTNQLLFDDTFLVYGIVQFLALGENVFMDNNQVFDDILMQMATQLNINVHAITKMTPQVTIEFLLKFRGRDSQQQMPRYQKCMETFNPLYYESLNNMHILFLHAMIRINDMCPMAEQISEEAFNQVVMAVCATIKSLSHYYALDCYGTLAKYLIVHFHDCKDIKSLDVLRMAIEEFMSFLSNNHESILPNCNSLECSGDVSDLMSAVEIVVNQVNNDVVALHNLSPERMIRELEVHLMWPHYAIHFVILSIMNEAPFEQFFMASLLNEICLTYPQCRMGVYMIYLLTYTESSNMRILSSMFQWDRERVTSTRIKHVVAELEDIGLLAMGMFDNVHLLCDEMKKFQQTCTGINPNDAPYITFDEFVEALQSVCMSFSLFLRYQSFFESRRNLAENEDPPCGESKDKPCASKATHDALKYVDGNGNKTFVEPLASDFKTKQQQKQQRVDIYSSDDNSSQFVRKDLPLRPLPKNYFHDLVNKTPSK